jgi:hypothetical protein
MEYAIGILLALGFSLGATATGLDRERAFYTAVAMAVATYYILFAAMTGSASVVIAEAVAAGAFLLLAIVGFRTRPWLIALAIGGHGVFDVFHHLLIDNPGVPRWWPGFCMSFDVVAGGYLALLLLKRQTAGSVN